MILPLGKTRSRLAFDVPNARAKGRGRTKLGETGQSVTPRPLERRVGPRQGRHFTDDPAKKPKQGALA